MSRINIHNILKTITTNVYYQPDANIRLSYPAIVYSRDSIEGNHADNMLYTMEDRYTVTYITKNPDDANVKMIMRLPLVKYSRDYISDGLYHTIFEIYSREN